MRTCVVIILFTICINFTPDMTSKFNFKILSLDIVFEHNRCSILTFVILMMYIITKLYKRRVSKIIPKFSELQTMLRMPILSFLTVTCRFGQTIPKKISYSSSFSACNKFYFSPSDVNSRQFCALKSEARNPFLGFTCARSFTGNYFGH